MAAPTLVTQLRDAQVTNAVARFQIITTVTDRGDLPDTGAFVMEIIDEDDPKQDVLLRIADVGDLSEYRIDRSIAVYRGEQYYREATYTKTLDDLSAAITAKDFIQEELNQLASDWQTFITEFQTAGLGEALAFPQADIGVLAPLIADYEETVALRQAQEELVTEKTADCAELDTTIAETQALVDAAQVSLDALNSSLTALNSGLSAMQTLQTAITGTLQPEIEGTFAAWDTEEPGLTGTKTATNGYIQSGVGTFRLYYEGTFIGVMTTYAQEIANLTAARDAVVAEIATVTAQLDDPAGLNDQLDTAVADKAACAAELVELQAVLDEYETLEQDQLNTIVALCPTYTP